jgi:hypothetical protein
MQMVECVLVQHVRLVDEKDGEHSLARKVFDIPGAPVALAIDAAPAQANVGDQRDASKRSSSAQRLVLSCV